LGVACAIIAYGIALIAGRLYFDPRPFVQFHFKPLIEHDTENGFPSDHVLLVATVAAVVTVFNKRISIFLWVCTLMIAFARVYVGVHHYRDVVMSIAIASLVTFILFLFFKKKLQPEIVS
jgi:undecaprenyl-diphosphatase